MKDNMRQKGENLATAVEHLLDEPIDCPDKGICVSKCDCAKCVFAQDALRDWRLIT